MAPSFVSGCCMSAKVDEAIRRDVAIRKAIEENNVEFSKQVSIALGELAYQMKADFLQDREALRELHNQNVVLRSRVDELEERFNMVNGDQAGRVGSTPKLLPQRKYPPT